MDREVLNFILQKAKENKSFSQDYFPIETENLCIGIADSSNHFLDLGIREGTLLFFDRSKPHKDGVPALYIDLKSGTMIALRHSQPGLRYAGTLVATLSRTAEV